MRVAIPGAAGRMGCTLVREVAADDNLKLVGAIEAAASLSLGKDAGAVAGIENKGVPIVGSLAEGLANAEGVIDFTVPSVTVELAGLCAERGTAMVIGTTGLSAAEAEQIEQAAKRIPIVWAPNMSVGINVLIQLVQNAARLLGADYDLEIVEAHHKHKKDAPSGTALRLAEALAEATSERGTLAERACYGRQGQSEGRPKDEIGIHTVRGGDVVGDHTVYYCTDGERLELTHRASSRQTFAKGAVRALHWLNDREAGLYDMQHVLGLKEAKATLVTPRVSPDGLS
jgi:4-hydroxy-tetrahydrodipicolinate reductase